MDVHNDGSIPIVFEVMHLGISAGLAELLQVERLTQSASKRGFEEALLKTNLPVFEAIFRVKLPRPREEKLLAKRPGGY